MVNRSIATLSRLCASAALVLLGTTALLQITGATPAVAAGNSNGIFGWGTSPALESLPVGVTPLAVAAGWTNGYAIGSDANLYAWGPNINGSLPVGEVPVDATTPIVVSFPAGVTPTAIAGGFDAGYAIGSDGNLYAWGWNGQGELGIGNDTGPDACPVNGFGQPGPTGPCAATPVKVDLPPGVNPTAIATSGETEAQPSSAYAIGSNGKLYAWGDNSSGQLGDGNTSESDAPVVVSLPSGVTPTAIAGGTQAAYAIGSDGKLYAWGENGVGALGNGTTTSSDTPVVVSLPPGVTPKVISGGGGAVIGGFGYMVGSDGNLYAWGYNGDGELGDGTTTGPEICTVTLPPPFVSEQFPCSTTPVKVSLPPSVTAPAIAGNARGGTALGSDGNLYAWGQGQLGNGSSGGSDTPVLVSVPSGSVGVSLGQGSSATVSYAIVNAPNVAPTVTTQPTSQSVKAGLSATFTAAASGLPTPTVQWKVSTDGGATFSPVTGATTDALTIPAVTTAENGNQYEAVFTNGLGSATTNPAALTVIPPVAPTITTQPSNQTDIPGQIATFTATASGDPTPTVVWQVSYDGGSTWSNIVGNSTSNSTTLSGPIYGTFENGWQVRAVFTNIAGSATTNPATLTVLSPVTPTITTQPIDQTASPGQMATFTAAASGTPTPTVQWQVSYDGGSTWSDIMGNPTSVGTTLSGVIFGTFENGWQVRAVFTNGSGSATTKPATLTVP